MSIHTMNLYTDLDYLVEHTRAGDTLSLDELARDSFPAAYRFAASILDDPDDAEDAAQEAVISALAALDKYRGESSFRTWLFAITLNACRKYLRKRKARRTLDSALQLLSWNT